MENSENPFQLWNASTIEKTTGYRPTKSHNATAGNVKAKPLLFRQRFNENCTRLFERVDDLVSAVMLFGAKQVPFFEMRLLSLTATIKMLKEIETSEYGAVRDQHQGQAVPLAPR